MFLESRRTLVKLNVKFRTLSHYLPVMLKIAIPFCCLSLVSSKSSLQWVFFFQINDRQQFRMTKIRPSSHEGFIHIIMLMSLNIYSKGLYYLQPYCIEGNYILLPLLSCSLNKFSSLWFFFFFFSKAVHLDKFHLSETFHATGELPQIKHLTKKNFSCDRQSPKEQLLKLPLLRKMDQCG